MRFVKMHGLGNDFRLIDARCTGSADWRAAARRLCDRRFGVGGDGLLLLLESDTCDWRMQVINSDGSEAGMCGNGIRCFAKYLRDEGLDPRDEVSIETLGGVIRPRFVAYDGGRAARVAVDMGEPRLRPEDIPFNADEGAERVVDAYLQVDDDPMQITCVSMGNPHCVLFVEELKGIRLEWWGPMIERHERFPNKTNVEFVRVDNPRELTMRVWERGAGRTLACGTGACASLVAAVLNGHAERRATVHLEGGDLDIEWREADNRVIMTGPAETVFVGETAD
ncbi:MAG: diaminopimelate epimerase [Armatimonadetes bacterium]|nr:diaminopimelate epimerase [Armatimonadota bacterium]